MTAFEVNRFRGASLLCLLASGFGVGHASVAPGTLGTLLALPLWYWGGGGGAIHAAVLLVVLAVSVPAARAEIARTGRSDPSSLVLDEVAGMLLAATGIPWGWGTVLPLFALFRLFDIVKVGPAAWLDAREGAVYAIADDLAAGLYANLAYRGISWLIG